VSSRRTFNLASEDRKKISEFSTCPTNSHWFKRFMLGCRKRMGEDVRPNLALSIKLMMECLARLKLKIEQSRGERQRHLIAVATYLTVCYAASLRGNEGFMVDLRGLRMLLERGGEDDAKFPHVTVPLLGRFKNEHGERCHLMPLSSTSKSGLEPRMWLEMLVKIRETEGRMRGPLFCGKDGRVARSKDYEETFHKVLSEIKDTRPDLIPAEVDVDEDFGLNRSLRRGSSTTAARHGVSTPVVDLINRWRKVENAQGMKPALGMREHYTEIRQMLEKLLEYSKSL
jgi:hypothetical protein